MSTPQIEKMIEKQLVARGISQPAVLRTMREVDRARFVPQEARAEAYEDHPISIGEGQTISQPYMVATMLEAAELKETDRVLDIGTGSGYSSALLSRIVQKLYTIERLAPLARNAQERLKELGYRNIYFLIGDGSLGWKEEGPFDEILVAAATKKVPQALIDQLKIGGRLIIPIESFNGSQTLMRIRKTGEREFSEEALSPVRFVPLISNAFL